MNPDKFAPLCDDQIPVLSTLGRGLQGDAYVVKINRDSEDETILEGFSEDPRTGELRSEWLSENVNGGRLRYQYNLRPHTLPRTFTITFKYTRPGRPEWSWTTPAIPYIWSVDEDGCKTEPEAIVGSGVATVFVKKTGDSEWAEKLLYPEGFDREDFNAPEQGEAWTVNLEFGVGGDVEVPNIDDIAKILGITVQDVRKIIAGNKFVINGISAENIINYIDKQDDNHVDETLDHVHADLGFFTGHDDGHADDAFGGQASVKAYIDAKMAELEAKLGKLADSLGDVIYGAEVDEDGSITIPEGTKIPVGNINVISGADDFSDGYIRTSDSVEDDDVKAV